MDREPSVYVLTGACSTGKTTILNHYKQAGDSSIVTVDEAAREYYEQNAIPDVERGSLANQEKIQDFYIAKYEAARRAGVQKVLGDSSPLSSAAYAGVRSEEAKAYLFDRIRNTWMPTVTRFLLLEESDIDYAFDPDDPVRRESPEQRQMVHHILTSLLIEAKAPYTVISGNITERLEAVNQILS